jgi:hypothetical protein
MKRYMLWSMLAPATIILALMPSVATAQEQFKAQFSGSADGTHEGKYWLVTGTGSGTYVGSFSFEAHVHFYGTMKRIAGPMTITAANGDLLYGTCDHTWDAATTTWAGTYTLSGGTGRFANATGSGDFDVVLDLTARTAAGSFVGTISF